MAKRIVVVGGVRAHPLITGLNGVTLARGKRLVVDAMFRAGGRGDLIALGRTDAGAELARVGNIVLGGFLAWTIWRANYLLQLLACATGRPCSRDGS